MRLQIDDFVAIDFGEKSAIYRLQQISRDGRMYFVPPNEANAAARVKAKQIDFLVKSANQLREGNARKVHLSPAGRVSYESRAREDDET